MNFQSFNLRSRQLPTSSTLTIPSHYKIALPQGNSWLWYFRQGVQIDITVCLKDGHKIYLETMDMLHSEYRALDSGVNIGDIDTSSTKQLHRGKQSEYCASKGGGVKRRPQTSCSPKVFPIR